MKHASPSLAEFSRKGLPARSDTSSRVSAGLLTAVLYALFAALVWRASLAPPTPARSEIVARLLRDVPKRRAAEPPPPFLAHLVRPRAEKPALPVYTIASGAPPQTLAVPDRLAAAMRGAIVVVSPLLVAACAVVQGT